jgi:hypothetical protein
LQKVRYSFGMAFLRSERIIHFHKMLPESKLILSGGSAFDPVPDAKVMGDVALALGVDKQNLFLYTAS